MCDVLLRLPLSVFVRLVNVPFEVPGLNEYLSHPARQHYLLRHLPADMRARLLHKRKYIFSVHEVAQRLCFIGALQFGPQKLKEKDQVSAGVAALQSTSRRDLHIQDGSQIVQTKL